MISCLLPWVKKLFQKTFFCKKEFALYSPSELIPIQEGGNNENGRVVSLENVSIHRKTLVLMECSVWILPYLFSFKMGWPLSTITTNKTKSVL